MAPRIKLSGPTIETRAQLDDLVGRIREMTIRKNQVLLDREVAIKSIDERTGPVLEEITTTLNIWTEQALRWAEAHPEEFGKHKSLETIHGVLGWRTGNVSLKTLAGWTWDRVLEKIRSLPAMIAYIRAKEEVAKDVILSDREVLGSEGLRLIGVKVVQTETFFVEPKIEETENRQTA